MIFELFKMLAAIVAKKLGDLGRVLTEFFTVLFLTVENSERILFVTGLAGLAQRIEVVFEICL